jgi:hypothetical protein
MKKCKFCGLPIEFRMDEGGKWEVLNPDGTSHKRKCFLEKQLQYSEGSKNYPARKSMTLKPIEVTRITR